MKYLYFSKGLKDLSQDQLVEFLVEGKLDGIDLAVRPGYPIHPDNVRTELPSFVKKCQAAGKKVGLLTAPTSLNRPEDPQAIRLFEAAGASGVPFVKIGYFPYRGEFSREMKEARAHLEGFSRLALKTGTRALHHTHSGSNLGCNGISSAWLLKDLDPHGLGVLLDPGHLSLCGGPFPMEFDAVREFVAMLSLKDMMVSRAPGKSEPSSKVVPAGAGLVAWDKVGQTLRKARFEGMASIHAEYEVDSLAQRKRLLAQELDFFKARFP